MPKIRTELLREGMVLQADVKNMDNMLLLPAGCKIVEKHQRVLAAWGIGEVQVEACPETEAPPQDLNPIPPEVKNQLAQELAGIFWDPVDIHPFQAETYQCALRLKASQISTAAPTNPTNEASH